MLWGAALWGASTVKVTVQLAVSCRRAGGVNGYLEQWVGFAGVLFGNKPSMLV